MQARDLACITRAGGLAAYQGTERTAKQVGRDALMACGRWLVHGGSRVCGVPQCEVTRAVKGQAGRRKVRTRCAFRLNGTMEPYQ